MLDRLRIITDSCLATNSVHRRGSWSFQRVRREFPRGAEISRAIRESARRASQSSFRFNRREALSRSFSPSLFLSLPFMLHVCSIIPTLPVFLSFSPPGVPYTPRFGSSRSYTRTHRSDAHSVGVSREVRVRAYARTHIRMHAWTDKATGTRSKNVIRGAFGDSLRVSRSATLRAVCGRSAAKRKRARSVIRDMREIEIIRNAATTQLDASVLVRLSILRGNPGDRY